MSNLITVEKLSQQLADPDLRIIDTRFALSDPAAGYSAYSAGHIPKAIFLDLNKYLSSPVGEHGGRHPLPDMQQFATTLAQAGVGNSNKVVVYDEQAGACAGRLWWLLKYAGHDAVQVLDGGLPAWVEADHATNQETPEFGRSEFKLNLRPHMQVDMDYVKQNLNNPTVQIIDARSAERYRGENETLDHKAGHIPGALSVPFADNLSGNYFKPSEQLAARFVDLGLANAQEVIVYCGSGVSANHSLIALQEAGIENAKLYVGSWSDWISYQDNPIACGE